MSQGQDSLRATDTIYMFPFNGKIQPGVVLVSLVPPSSAVLLADPQWTSSDEHTCSNMKTTSHEAMLGVWEGPALPALEPAIGTVKHKYPP